VGNILRPGDPELFLQKFEGRTDRYALQTPLTGPACGWSACTSGPGHYHQVHKRLTVGAVEEHLLGTADGRYTIGAYTVGAGNMTRLLVWDIDDGSIDTALLVCETLHELGVGAEKVYLEFSGRRGYHVWLLLERPMDAEPAYRAAQAVVQASGQEYMEAYPKQPALTGKGYGNCIKLPWGVHAANNGWSRSVLEPAPGWRYPEWRDVAWTTEDDVRRLAQTYRETVRPEAPALVAAGSPLPPCMHRVLHEGVDKGMRDVAGYTLARHARKNGLTEDEALARLLAASQHFSGVPAPTEAWARTKVRNAYRTQGGIDCTQPFLHNPSNLLCSSLCPRYRTIPGALATSDAPEGSAHARHE
jgi:hypothetical protein